MPPVIAAAMLRSLLASLILALPLSGGDRIVLCGAEEVFQIDPAAAPQGEAIRKLWSWRAKDRPEIPADLKPAFGTTDECKALDNGRRMLVCSSGGGCALLEMPSGKALWWARVTNAHSIEALPGGLIAVAASTGASGNKVVLFESRSPGKPLFETPLPSAHGLVWDSARECLWALGYKELLAFTLKIPEGKSPLLEVKSRHLLPDEDGHDLRAVPGSADLVLSSHAHVWRFDRDKAAFRPDPDLKDRLKTKCVDIHLETGRMLVVQAAGGNWWTDTIGMHHPAATLTLKGERIYKARWFPAAE